MTTTSSTWWKNRRRLTIVVVLISILLSVLVIWLSWDNYHEVVPGRVYRSAQPSAASLHRRIRADGLRSVLNLRGANPQHGWYQEECAATEAHGIPHFDLAMGTVDVPTGAKLREIITMIDACPKPMLIHCQSGIDRTGVVSAVCILLEEDGSPEKALNQFGWRYGSTPWRRHRDRQESFVRRYAEWLSQRGEAHTPNRFRLWAATTDDPGLSELAWLDH
jgi:protein tyrosine phosphatase (PTP) superfamily phosphohydrolase (DUF442 family)